MGINKDNLLSDEHHAAHFSCAICQDLSEAPVVLACSHVFCEYCIGEYVARSLDRQQNALCPTCRAADCASATRLSEANPLAFRCYAKVQTKCPLHAQGCTWTGDLGSLQGHLTNSDSHLTNMSQGDVYDALKKEGDERYRARAYDQAADLYSKACAVAPGRAQAFANRAACRLMAHRYEECVQDCDRALERDSALANAATRRARALLELGRTADAQRGLAEFSVANGGASVSDEARRVDRVATAVADGRKAFADGDLGKARASFAGALRDAESAPVVLGAAAAELGLGKIDRCLRLCLQVLRRADAARWRPAALVVRGAATLLSDEGPQAVEILRQALRLDPDGAAPKATLRAALRVVKRRREARDLATKRSFAAASKAYDQLLTDDLGSSGAVALDGFPALAVLAARSPLYARCRAERGTCRLRCGDADAALKDCAAALYVVDDLVDAHLCRANALRHLKRHAEARKFLQEIIEESWGGSDVRVKHAFEQADFDMRRTNRPDYYALLNCRKVSSEREIKGAYHAQSLLHHPDRHATAPVDVQKAEAEVFKRLGQALDILGDPQKRELYDKGFDKEAIHAKLEAAKRASNNHSCSGGGCGGC